MTDLERIMSWIKTYEGFDQFTNIYVDYTSQMPSNGGLFPSGSNEIERKTDILGNVTITKQLNFALYSVMDKAAGDDTGAIINQELVADFENWVEEQSIKGLAPIFGDRPHEERITAQNGGLYDVTDEGLATYMIQITVTFKKVYEV